MAARKVCTHLDQINPNVKAKTPQGCEECLKTGDSWVELRICMTCGHVGCCNASKNKHATKHFLETGHPIIKDYPRKDWTWCYVDEIYVD
jgi:uncharacterized UBP type Zn finger protein